MLGLMKKDYYNIQGSLKFYILTPLLFAMMSYANQSLDFLAFGTCFMGAMIVISCFAYDDMSHFNEYALTLPIEKKDLVISKYVMADLFLLIVFLLSNLLAFGMNLIAPERFLNFDGMAFIQYTFIASMLVNIITSMMLVLMFKYGSEKGRILFIISFVGLGLLFGISKDYLMGLDLERWIEFLNQSIVWLSMILSILIQGVCTKLSIGIMNKKEL